MASLDRRLNPLYAIKECSSFGNFHTKDCGCSKGNLEDKILVPRKKKKRIGRASGLKIDYWKVPLTTMMTERLYLAIALPMLTDQGAVNSLKTVCCTFLEVFKEHSEIVVDSNNDYSSSDDDSYENIGYVDASPSDAEIVSLEVVEIVIRKLEAICSEFLKPLMLAVFVL
ncbi:hypothetical protein Tco_0455671 [Tanacetum coccineum]